MSYAFFFQVWLLWWKVRTLKESELSQETLLPDLSTQIMSVQGNCLWRHSIWNGLAKEPKYATLDFVPIELALQPAWILMRYWISIVFLNTRNYARYDLVEELAPFGRKPMYGTFWFFCSTISDRMSSQTITLNWPDLGAEIRKPSFLGFDVFKLFKMKLFKVY